MISGTCAEIVKTIFTVHNSVKSWNNARTVWKKDNQQLIKLDSEWKIYVLIENNIGLSTTKCKNERKALYY